MTVGEMITRDRQLREAVIAVVVASVLSGFLIGVAAGMNFALLVWPPAQQQPQQQEASEPERTTRGG
jgi:hypothetical protein